MTQNERWQWQKVTDGRFFCESSIIGISLQMK